MKILSTKNKSTSLDKTIFPFEKEVKFVQDVSYRLENSSDLDPLMERIGDAKIVMLGESSHGTHEYYSWRARLSKRLISEKGFSFIAVEGDWPDCYRLNRYVKSYKDSGNSIKEVLNEFNRWPTWMWANWEIAAFAEWMKKNNALKNPDAKKVGFYGLDVYSLWESLEATMEYLKRSDPDAYQKARLAWACFEPYADEEGQAYARANFRMSVSCEREVVDLLDEIRRKITQYNTDHENVFSTEQNALVMVHAEQYYRAMVKMGPGSWNIRDRHMEETLERLLEFHGPDSKAIVWEHNTHIGDARATDMAIEGMVNIGELARDRYSKKEVVLVGFGSYSGEVIAGQEWGGTMKKMILPKAQMNSWENILHIAGANDKLIITEDLQECPGLLNYIPHRAIGVVYNSGHEQYGNYVPSIIPNRYDAFIYLDETTALHPLHIKPNGHQIPETYPWGL